MKKDNQSLPGILYWRPGFGEKGEIIRKLGQTDSPKDRDRCYKSCGNLAPTICERDGDTVDEHIFKYYFRTHNYSYIGSITGKSYEEEFIYTTEIDDIFEGISYKDLYTDFVNTWNKELGVAQCSKISDSLRSLSFPNRYYYYKYNPEYCIKYIKNLPYRLDRTKYFVGHCRAGIYRFGTTFDEILKNVSDTFKFDPEKSSKIPDSFYSDPNRILLETIIMFRNAIRKWPEFDYLSSSNRYQLEDLFLSLLITFKDKDRYLLEDKYLNIIKGNH